MISSVYSTNYSDKENASSFEPYPEKISIHDNRYAGGGNDPDTNYLPQLKDAIFGKEGSFPNVIWDGFLNPELIVDGKLPAEYQICIYNEDSSAVFNVDTPNQFANPAIGETEHQCRHSPLPAVELGRF